MRIKFIEPVLETEDNKNSEEDLAYFRNCLSADDYLEVEFIEEGYETLETVTDESFMVPDIIRKIIKAEKDGFDGVYVNCAADPGVFQAKELVKIPVVGPLSCSILLSGFVGRNITIMSVSSINRECEEYWIERTGLSSLVSNLRFPELTIMDFMDYKSSLEKTYKACRETVENDNCDVIILGCSTFFRMKTELENKLRQDNIHVQLVEPIKGSLKMLKILIEMNLTGSFNGRISSHINEL